MPGGVSRCNGSGEVAACGPESGALRAVAFGVRRLVRQLKAVTGLQVPGFARASQPELTADHLGTDSKRVGVCLDHLAGGPFARQYFVKTLCSGLRYEFGKSQCAHQMLRGMEEGKGAGLAWQARRPW